MSELDNIRRWTGDRGHYEVWYVTLNHRASQTGYWIRYTMEAPLREPPYAQLWFACFDRRDPARTFAINQVLPIGDMSAMDAPFSVRIADTELTHTSARGRIRGNGHEASWDFSWLPAAETHHHLPGWIYKGDGLGDTTVLSPNLDVPIRGRITVDGDTRELAGDPGGQTHLWGKKHAHEWAWGHCNAFEGRPRTALEVLTARLEKRGRVLPPATLVSLYLDGERIQLTGLRHAVLASASYDTARYAFRSSDVHTRVEGEYSCRPEDMVVARYADPDGEPSWCANTEVADLRVTVWRRSGVTGRWREAERLLAPGTGHFEVGARQRDPAVAKDHVTVP